MSAPERDPRVDPKPGDVLRKKYRGGYLFESPSYLERYVDEVYVGSDGRIRVVYSGENVCTPEILIATWRLWARAAEVIKQAV